MIRIIYRIYEKVESSEDSLYGIDKKIVHQDVMQCEDREHFKEIIKSMYDNKISFRNSSKLNVGDLFCTIISESCYNSEDYLQVFSSKCSCCGKEILYNNGKNALYKIPKYKYERLNYHFYKKVRDKINDNRYCCQECLDNAINEIDKEYEDFKDANNEIDENEWIKREDFQYLENCCGYIYKITKKSSNEIYIGQTKYLPIFRWGQHLKTERFKLNDIDNYTFEVIEKVKNKDDILKREEYWINYYYKLNPKLLLNIVIPNKNEYIDN